MFFEKNQIFHYTRGITPKRVMSGGALLRGYAPGYHNSGNVEAVVSRWLHCARYDRLRNRTPDLRRQ